MKFFNGRRLNAKTGIILWVVIHAVLIILGVSVPWKMDSDLYSILPDSNEIKNVSAAEKVLSARSVRNITVLVGHENFDVARSAAIALNNAFKGDSSFEETRLFVKESGMEFAVRKSVRDSGSFRHGFTLVWRKMRKSVRDKACFRHVLRNPGFRIFEWREKGPPPAREATRKPPQNNKKGRPARDGPQKAMILLEESLDDLLLGFLLA